MEEFIKNNFNLNASTSKYYTNEELMSCIEKQGSSITCIANATPEMQLKALTRDRYVLRYIEKPTKEMIDIAFKNEFDSPIGRFTRNNFYEMNGIEIENEEITQKTMIEMSKFIDDVEVLALNKGLKAEERKFLAKIEEELKEIETKWEKILEEGVSNGR